MTRGRRDRKRFVNEKKRGKFNLNMHECNIPEIKRHTLIISGYRKLK